MKAPFILWLLRGCPEEAAVRRCLRRSLAAGLLSLLVVLADAPDACGQLQSLVSVRRTNRRICGRVVEFTRQHGSDNRLWSAVLCQRRDVYVYLPPGYSPSQAYPLVLWLHGAFGDEHAFLDTAQLETLDRLICRGCCPPVVVVAPDLTCKGKNFILAKHSLGVDGCCGAFQQHLLCEMLPWVRRHYSVRSEPWCTTAMGVSAGGMAAMNLALKHRDQFGIAASLSGALNLRYGTRQHDYFGDFDPATFCMQSTWLPDQIVGRLGPITLKAKTFLEPVFGFEPGVVNRIIRENPADLICSTGLGPSELRLLVSYGCQDQLNFDAHAASFVWLCSNRGVAVDLDVDPEGKHDSDYFDAAQGRAWSWLGRQLQELQ